MKKAVIILSILLTISIGINIYFSHSKERTKVDITTITYRDTIKVVIPMPVDSVVIRYITEVLPLADSTGVGASDDSAKVVIPIEQKQYKTADYTAYVSGYRPKLDSLLFYPKTTIITKEITKKPSRWGISVIGGYGVGVNGASPFVGVGLSYSFIRF